MSFSPPSGAGCWVALSPDSASPRLRLVCDKNDKFVSNFISSETFKEEDINIITYFLPERREIIFV